MQINVLETKLGRSLGYGSIAFNFSNEDKTLVGPLK